MLDQPTARAIDRFVRQEVTPAQERLTQEKRQGR